MSVKSLMADLIDRYYSHGRAGFYALRSDVETSAAFRAKVKGWYGIEYSENEVRASYAYAKHSSVVVTDRPTRTSEMIWRTI